MNSLHAILNIRYCLNVDVQYVTYNLHRFLTEKLIIHTLNQTLIQILLFKQE